MDNVVVTGIGLVTPLGLGREKTWNSLLSGLSAVSKDREYPGIITARIKDLPIPDQVRLTSIAFLAANEAIFDSQIRVDEVDSFGCTLSVSKHNLSASPKGSLMYNDALLTSDTGRQIKRILMLKGPVTNTVAACATGVVSIATGARWIQQGLCDAVLCGAAEASFHPLYVAGFSQMGVLAKNRACPFNALREGFAMGEGAAALILERKDKAVLRGAKVYCEIAGWNLSNSAENALSFSEDGAEITSSIKKALLMAGLENVDYINAHGTGTRINDRIETIALKNALGIGAKSVSISSTKAATGHLLGAAGAVESAFAILSLRDQVVPPTLNLDVPDPECDLDYTPGNARKKTIRSAMSLSFGFGGQIGTLIVNGGAR